MLPRTRHAIFVKSYHHLSSLTSQLWFEFPAVPIVPILSPYRKHMRMVGGGFLFNYKENHQWPVSEGSWTAHCWGQLPGHQSMTEEVNLDPTRTSWKRYINYTLYYIIYISLYTLNILNSFKIMKLLIKHLKWRQNLNLGIVLPPSRPCRMPGTGGSESCLGNGLGKHRLCAKCLASERFPRSSSNLHVDMLDVYNEMYGYAVV